MPKKPYIERSGQEWYIFPSADDKNYVWAVFNDACHIVAQGKQRTYDSAFRAVRNFIKNNQNAVYGYEETV
jgi:maltose-binding protein MalE